MVNCSIDQSRFNSGFCPKRKEDMPYLRKHSATNEDAQNNRYLDTLNHAVENGHSKPSGEKLEFHECQPLYT